MAELVDALDSKSGELSLVLVRFQFAAPETIFNLGCLWVRDVAKCAVVVTGVFKAFLT